MNISLTAFLNQPNPKTFRWIPNASKFNLYLNFLKLICEGIKVAITKRNKR